MEGGFSEGKSLPGGPCGELASRSGQEGVKGDKVRRVGLREGTTDKMGVFKLNNLGSHLRALNRGDMTIFQKDQSGCSVENRWSGVGAKDGDKGTSEEATVGIRQEAVVVTIR